MQITGTIKGGVVVPDSLIEAPDETKVILEIADESEDPGEWVKEYVGCVEDMPEDASLNYHHALSGARKR